MPAHNLRQMTRAGVRLFQVDLWLQDIWTGPGRALDMQLARKQVRGVLEACPEASVVIRLHVNAPVWWRQAHPEESVQYADGPAEAGPQGLPFNHEDGDIYRVDRTSLASERWRTEAGVKLREFCRQLAHTREGKSVIGLHIAGGVYGEWHPWGFIKHEPDVSEPMTRAFRMWLKNKYQTTENLQKAWGSGTLENATVPDTLERQCCSDGFFRDPVTETRVMDFYQAYQSVIADDIELFCRIAKESWGRPLLVGVFNVYSQFGLCRQAINGHLEAERLLKSPWIDYFAGPPSYYEPSRLAGGSGLQRAPIKSVLLHGKLWFDEIDNGYLQDDQKIDFVRSKTLGDTNYLPVLQRSLWMPMAQGCGLWLYDFGPRRNTGWWDGPMYLEEISRSIALFREEYGKPVPAAAADALVVWDTDSYYAVKNVNTRDCDKGLDAAAEELQRAGVALDHIFQFDLPLVDLRPYRAVLFMNAWQIRPEMRQFIRDSVAQQGRTLIWNAGSGYADGQKTSIKLTENLTGIRFDRLNTGLVGVDTVKNQDWVSPTLLTADPAAGPLSTLLPTGNMPLVRKKVVTHTVVYAGIPLHDTAVFRSLLSTAGCRVWQDQGEALTVGRQYLVRHWAKGGQQRPVTRLQERETGMVRFE